MPKFQPGQSGNPAGRPKKERTLTNLLELEGTFDIEYRGEVMPRNKLMARLLWQFVTEGEVEMPNGKIIRPLGARDWAQAIKEIYKHVDGSPRLDVDLTSGGEPIRINVALGEEEDED